MVIRNCSPASGAIFSCLIFDFVFHRGRGVESCMQRMKVTGRRIIVRQTVLYEGPPPRFPAPPVCRTAICVFVLVSGGWAPRPNTNSKSIFGARYSLGSPRSARLGFMDGAIAAGGDAFFFPRDFANGGDRRRRGGRIGDAATRG